MTVVALGVADQTLAISLKTTLSEIEGVDICYVAESGSELVSAVTRLSPDVVFVHDQLGPDPVWPVIRDLASRLPGCALLVTTADPSPEVFARAMDSGARGVVTLPLSYEDIRARLVGASDWARQMQRLLAGSGLGRDDTASARILAFVGAKGGVGTTTIATHLALDSVRALPGQKVCLVDLDLEKGDVTAVLDVRHGRSIADLAKVAADLSPFTVPDAIVVHESGLHVLLTPADVRDVDAITLLAVRQIFSVLRTEYDVIVVDGGSHVTPMQATLVDLADEVVVVSNPDVSCLRSLRRALSAWETLGVRREAEVRVLLNRMSRADLVQGDVGRMVQAQVLGVGLAAMYRRLEPAINSRDPLAVRDRGWWEALRAIGREIGVGRGQTAGAPGVAESPSGGRRAPRRDDGGSIAVETVTVVPAVLAVCLVCWQVLLIGLTFVWSGHAAGAGARALSVNRDPGPAARAAVPGSVAGNLSIDPERAGVTDRVTVSLPAPLVAPGIASLPLRISSTRSVVVEP